MTTTYSTTVDKALALMDEHGLLDAGWTLKFNNNKSNAGVCNYTKRTIFLSRFYLNNQTEESSWNTVTHEIAHALVGPGHGHGKVWKAMHKALGGTGDRCFVPTAQAREEYLKVAKWTGTCPKNSEHKLARSRMTQRSRNSSCGICKNTYDPTLRLIWTQNY